MFNFMNRPVSFKFFAVLIGGLVGLGFILPLKQAKAAPLIINHTHANVSGLSTATLNAVKSKIKWHYAHTSHGGQVTIGLNSLSQESSRYTVAIEDQRLPKTSGALCVFDGQETDTYITPELYWESAHGRQLTGNVLNHNKTINISMWAWCSQLNYYNASQVRAYLNAMAAFEKAFPKVKFIYMTGNAQATGQEGYNRFRMNNLIRSWVKSSKNRVLFDFADLDSWWKNPSTGKWERSTYRYGSTTVPKQHPRFEGDEAGHTTYESCEQKAKAAWYMLSRLVGSSSSPPPTPRKFYIKGTVRTKTGARLYRVRLILSKAGSVRTNRRGNYAGKVNRGWKGSVTPYRTCWRFRPLRKGVTKGITANLTANFRAYKGVTVMGRILYNGKALSNVRVVFSNRGGTARTNSRGWFVRNLKCGWRGYITPVISGYTFSPKRRRIGSRLKRSLSIYNFMATK